MFESLEEKKLHLRTFFAPCSCKCDFCCYSQLSCNKQISIEAYEQILKKFSHLYEDTGIEVDNFIYNSIEYPMLHEQIRLSKALGYPYQNCLVMNMNGTKIRKGDELREWCGYLKRIGITTGVFSFLGTQEQHDCYVSHKGYYTYLINCAKQLKELGIKVRAHIFLRKEILRELPVLIPALDQVFDHVMVLFMEYLGSAKQMLSSFVDVDDYDTLFDLLKNYMNTTYINRYKSEAEWIQMALNGTFPKMKYTEYVLFITSDNVDRILGNDTVTILNWFRQKNARILGLLPPIDRIALAYGNPDSKILYDNRDILRKWMDAMFEAEGLDKSLLYSDTSSSVEWKSHERLLT